MDYILLYYNWHVLYPPGSFTTATFIATYTFASLVLYLNLYSLLRFRQHVKNHQIRQIFETYCLSDNVDTICLHFLHPI